MPAIVLCTLHVLTKPPYIVASHIILNKRRNQVIETWRQPGFFKELVSGIAGILGRQPVPRPFMSYVHTASQI